MDFTSKIMLFEGETGFFGPGVRNLFLNIEEEHSVKGASEKMGLSYSKAWKMIRNVEKALGEPAVRRIHGGTDGGSAQLTEAGKILLEKYIRVERRSLEATRKIFEEEFS